MWWRKTLGRIHWTRQWWGRTIQNCSVNKTKNSGVKKKTRNLTSLRSTAKLILLLSSLSWFIIAHWAYSILHFALYMFNNKTYTDANSPTHSDDRCCLQQSWFSGPFIGLLYIFHGFAVVDKNLRFFVGCWLFRHSPNPTMQWISFLVSGWRPFVGC